MRTAAPIRPADHRDTEPAVDWRQRAACRFLKGANANLMFPHPSNARDVARAKAVCVACPVRNQCAEYALDTRQDHGVWGGLTEEQRRSLVRSRRRHGGGGCGTESGYKAHNARREEPCGKCTYAHALYMTETRREALNREHTRGGSEAGARLHKLLGQEACEACAEARRREQRARDEAQAVRNDEIAKARIAGETTHSLSVRYGVSVYHIRHLVRQYKARHGLTT